MVIQKTKAIAAMHRILNELEKETAKAAGTFVEKPTSSIRCMTGLSSRSLNFVQTATNCTR